MSLRLAPLLFVFKKLRADKRKPRRWRAVRDQMGGSWGVLIKQIADGLMKIISRIRWSYSRPGRQITVKNSHVNGGKVSYPNIIFCGKVSCLNIIFSRRKATKMKVGKETEMI